MEVFYIVFHTCSPNGGGINIIDSHFFHEKNNAVKYAQHLIDDSKYMADRYAELISKGKLTETEEMEFDDTCDFLESTHGGFDEYEIKMKELIFGD